MILIKQFKTGRLGNFTYVLGCEQTSLAMVIDPAGDIEKIISETESSNLKIVYILNTHGHFDHTSGNDVLKQKTGAKIIMHHQDAAQYTNADIKPDKEESLQLGEIHFQIIHTPGHTPGGICLYTEGNLFTGDTLFVGDSGRTDLTGGHRPTLGASIRKLMTFPDNTIIWPGHDYGPTPTSTIGWEKRHNVNAREYGFFIGD